MNYYNRFLFIFCILLTCSTFCVQENNRQSGRYNWLTCWFTGKNIALAGITAGSLFQAAPHIFNNIPTFFNRSSSSEQSNSLKYLFAAITIGSGLYLSWQNSNLTNENRQLNLQNRSLVFTLQKTKTDLNETNKRVVENSIEASHSIENLENMIKSLSPNKFDCNESSLDEES